MIQKAITIISIVLFAFGVLQVIGAITNSYSTYSQIAHYAGAEIANKYYLKNLLWKELPINLSIAALLFSLSFFIKRNRFSERSRNIITSCLIVSLSALMLGIIIDVVF